jgi:hypothetical protein
MSRPGRLPGTRDGGDGLEMFRKLLNERAAGDKVGCLLRGIEKDVVERGQVLCKPGSERRNSSCASCNRFGLTSTFKLLTPVRLRKRCLNPTVDRS